MFLSTFGKLKYRCANFEFRTLNKQSFQPNSVVNYTDKDVRFLRVTEFKKFYNKKSNKTVICKEFVSDYGKPSYPVINKDNLKLLEKYKKEKRFKNVIFVGRLAQYKYLNMDQVVREALQVFFKIKNKFNQSLRPIREPR
ncbi:UDP-galactopyranose mutase [subsurface metagenome]